MIDPETQSWLIERFDRIDEKMDLELRELKREVVDTRHAHRGSIDQIAVQVATLVIQMNTLATTQAQMERWRSEEGPLDKRFQRHDERIRANDNWRNRMIGAMVLVSALFPVSVAAIVAVLR